MNATDYRWSLGTLVWLPVAALLLLGLTVVAVLLLRWWWSERRHDSFCSEAPEALGFFGLTVFLIVLLVGGTFAGMWPYDAEYHQWRNTSGVVQTIDSRLLAQDHGSTQRFVVTFTDGRLRSCDDTRCAEVHKGDHLTLTCKRAWQWSGTHGYDCNFVSAKATR